LATERCACSSHSCLPQSSWAAWPSVDDRCESDLDCFSCPYPHTAPKACFDEMVLGCRNLRWPSPSSFRAPPVTATLFIGLDVVDVISSERSIHLNTETQPE
jgi:hypothetical protein